MSLYPLLGLRTVPSYIAAWHMAAQPRSPDGLGGGGGGGVRPPRPPCSAATEFGSILFETY